MIQSPERSRLQFSGHDPALDGLRGVAILMVLMLHFYNEAIINNGYPLIGPIITKAALSGLYGVELFFVLSGFLITRILLDSKDDPRYFRNFYMRRLLQIFPLYYGALCVLFLILPHLVTFDEAARDIASRQLWLWTFLSNLPWSGGKWDTSGHFRLGHFWFLCVLIHYYILWPPVVYKCEPRTIIRICLIGLVICFLLRAIHTVAGGLELLAWSSIGRLDGLLIGSSLAAGLRLEPVSRRIDHSTPKATWVAGIIFLMLLFVPRRLHTGYYWTVIETISVTFFGGMLIIVLRLRQAGTLPALMKNRVLVGFGKYSYGIYIIHNICVPLFQWLFKPQHLSTTLGSPLLAQAVFYALTASSSFLLAFLSWHLWELHFVKLKKFFEYTHKQNQAAVVVAAGTNIPFVT